MKAIIYKINSRSGKFYIGSTKNNLKKRMSIHLYYLKNNKHCNNRLQGAFNKYKELQIEVLEIFDFISKKDIELKEQYYIDLLLPQYNINLKAYRANMSENTKIKISKTLKGKKHSEERKQNISKGRKGVKPTMTEKFLKAIKNRDHLKVKIIGKNILTREEIVFNSFGEAIKNFPNISLSLKNNKPIKGFIFKYFEDSITDLDLIIDSLKKRTWGNKGVSSEFEDFFNAEECAKKLNVSLSTIQRALKKGKLKNGLKIFYTNKNKQNG